MLQNNNDVVNTHPNFLVFDNDDDFVNYCVCPNLVVLVTKNGTPYTDFNFTDDYLNAISNGTQIVIKDPASKIQKRNAVSFRSITKPVKNLMPYIGRLHDKYQSPIFDNCDVIDNDDDFEL